MKYVCTKINPKPPCKKGLIVGGPSKKRPKCCYKKIIKKSCSKRNPNPPCKKSYYIKKNKKGKKCCYKSLKKKTSRSKSTTPRKRKTSRSKSTTPRKRKTSRSKSTTPRKRKTSRSKSTTPTRRKLQPKKKKLKTYKKLSQKQIDEIKKVSKKFIKHIRAKIKKKIYERDINTYVTSKKFQKIKNNLLKYIAKKKQKKSTINNDLIDCIKRSKLQLRAHQINVVQKMLKPPHRLLVVHGVGTGKTLTSVTVSQCLLDLIDKIDGVIVATPASLVTNFSKELKAYGVNKDSRYQIVSHQKLFLPRGDFNPQQCKNKLLIIDEAHKLNSEIKIPKKENIEKWWNHPDQLKGLKRKLKKKYKNEKITKNRLLETRFEFMEGKTAYNALQCSYYADALLLLTATPIVNYPFDICNLMQMLHKEKIKLTAKKFSKSIMASSDNMIKYFGGGLIDFYKNPPNSSDFPTSKIHEVHIEMSPSFYEKYYELQTREFEKMFAQLAGRGDEIEGDPVAFFMGLRTTVNKQKSNDKNKAMWIVDKIKGNVSKNRPTVVFSQFRGAGVDLISSQLDKLNIKYNAVKGGLTRKKKSQAVIDYNTGKVIVLFITKAGGEGLDLKGTRDIILMEPTWNMTQEIQIIGRGVRYKSHDHLPSNQRHVDIWKILMVKPNILDRYQNVVIGYKYFKKKFKYYKITRTYLSNNYKYFKIYYKVYKKTWFGLRETFIWEGYDKKEIKKYKNNEQYVIREFPKKIREGLQDRSLVKNVDYDYVTKSTQKTIPIAEKDVLKNYTLKQIKKNATPFKIKIQRIEIVPPKNKDTLFVYDEHSTLAQLIEKNKFIENNPVYYKTPELGLKKLKDDEISNESVIYKLKNPLPEIFKKYPENVIEKLKDMREKDRWEKQGFSSKSGYTPSIDIIINTLCKTKDKAVTSLLNILKKV